jgi:DNA-binding response OmpR family regulator
MKILLLEDTTALNKAISKILTQDGHDVLSFTDGNDALNNIDSSIDLYLLDITVPNINGLELLEDIINYNSTANVIIMSADTSIESIKKAYEIGCIDFLKKPFDIEELRLKVDRLISKIDKLFSTVKFKDSSLKLTKKEKLLLQVLVENKNDIVTIETIEDFVYQDQGMSTDALRSLMKRLRSKLQDESVIKTMPYQGYMYMDL